ncbi:MAG: SDR family oxidoreductase [Bacteroidales bacterium]|nr:SDR family oxidoreductase [Bacteroidales bacterium]
MGRTVLITGTNRGIGKAIMTRFAKEKDITILAHARKETPEFLSLIEETKASNETINIVPVYFDLTNQEQIKDSLKAVLSVHKKVDVLVNNAGVVLPSKSFLMTDISQIRESFEVNFFAQVLITQTVCRAMIRNKGGAIVNMASIAAFSGIEGQFEYVSGKAAIVGMTRRLANELSAYNIRTNAVAPGMINTDMIMQMEENMRSALQSRLVSRRLGEPSEIANTVYFLASDEASYVNGQVITVNGGGVN